MMAGADGEREIIMLRNVQIDQCRRVALQARHADGPIAPLLDLARTVAERRRMR